MSSIESGAALRGKQKFDCDVVIVGSGASGAVAACVLAEAGLSVIVLEEGKHIPPEVYEKMRPTESLRHLWREGGMTAALGIGDTPVINVTMGKAVGGSSVLTGGVCFRTPDVVLDTWVNERGLDELSPSHMRPYFDEVERISHIVEVPKPMWSKSTQLFAEGAEKLGHPIQSTKRNTRDCAGRARCNFGCPSGAKMSVDKTFLPRATAAGARVISEVLVDRVLTKRSRAVGVRGRLLNRDGKPGDRIDVRAKRVVLAAGAAHTPLILMRSKIGKRSRQVGRNMTLHPSFRMIARFDNPVDGWKGSMQSAYSDAYEHERVTLVSVFLPPGTIATGVPGIGPEFTERVAGLGHLAMFGGLIHDDAGGRLFRGLGREPFMTYKMDKKDRAAIPSIIRRLGETFLAAGARELYLPIIGSEPVDADQFRSLDLERVKAKQVECSSQHPLGTCRMGSGPDNSVVDAWGKTWDLDELYLVDGSVVPSSLGVNPQETIMAMSLRLAQGIRDTPLPN